LHRRLGLAERLLLRPGAHQARVRRQQPVREGPQGPVPQAGSAAGEGRRRVRRRYWQARAEGELLRPEREPREQPERQLLRAEALEERPGRQQRLGEPRGELLGQP
jgi:hypothetical protein